MADIDALVAGSCSPEEIVHMVDNILANLSLDSFEQMLGAVTEARIAPQILGTFLRELATKILQTENKSLQIELLTNILVLSEKRIDFLNFQDCQAVRNAYTECLESNEYYSDAARYIESWDEPDEEFDKLRFFLRIGENYLKGADIGKSFSYLNKANCCIWRLRTPKDLIERFDLLRGHIHIARGSYLEASRSFAMLWTGARTPELQMEGLRKACICALISPASTHRSGMLRTLMEDDRVSSLDIYPMLDLTIRQKFIDKSACDIFREKVADVVTDTLVMSALETSATQHNLSVAQNMYTSVGISRLAQLIGDPYDKVEAQLERMIQNGTLKAVIDQPTSMVVFLQEDEDRDKKKDKDIDQFCARVRDIVLQIPKPE